MTRCAYVKCRKVIEHPKPGQKFCRGSACRAGQWHYENDGRCPNCGVRLKVALATVIGADGVESAAAGASA
jgi:hypothetical protein